MYNLSTSELSTLAIIFGILIITYFVLRSIFFPLLKKIAKRTSTFIDDFNINILGCVKILQAVLPRLQSSESASVVFFSTVAVKLGMPFHSSVSASKGAIEGLTRSLAAEFAPRIRVNAIAPGWVLTKKQIDKWATPDGLKAHLDRQCIKSHLKENDIAGGTLFLASSSSSMITGQLIAIDGGVVMTG